MKGRKLIIPFCLPLLLLVCSCSGEQERQRMAQIIAEADSMNRNFVPMTSDTLLLEACRYYDHYGTPNQRMMAYYLLGCVYRDRGEAPHAIDCYMDAVSKADTTASDCDYHVLGCVYGQMADIYHQQLLLTNEIEAYKCVTHCFIRANDPILYAIRSKILMGGVYILLNKKDSAELITKDAIRQLEDAGYLQEALTASTSLMHLYVEQHGKTEELKHWIDRYDTECSFFDQHHALPPNLRQFYYYKGWYYESTNELDSAEYYYRKIYYPGMSFVAMDPMYRGLLSVFEKRHEADSIAKYARLFCMVNDSSIAVKDRELTAHISATYDYSRHRQAAIMNAEKAKIARLWVIIAFLLLCFTIGFGCYYYYIQKRKKRMELEKLETAHKNDIQQIRKAQQDLMALHEQHYSELIEAKNSDIHALQFQLEEYQELQKHYQPESLEERLRSTASFSIFQEKLKHNINITAADWEQLHDDINTESPRFFGVLNARKPLSNTEYNLCILIRLGFQPKEQHVLLDLPMSYNLTVLRKRLLMKIFGIEGTAKELDQRILSIT